MGGAILPNNTPASLPPSPSRKCSFPDVINSVSQGSQSWLWCRDRGWRVGRGREGRQRGRDWTGESWKKVQQCIKIEKDSGLQLHTCRINSTYAPSGLKICHTSYKHWLQFHMKSSIPLSTVKITYKLSKICH
jgi:hypothetical protein